MVLRERMIPCHSREAVVTVISYHYGIMDGYVQHPRLNKRERVRSLSQMILLMNSLMDLEHCLNRPLPLIRQECDSVESIAVFNIQIFFREHYTWQGRLVWEDQKKEIIFHSAMELTQLIDEILAE